jgi:hypothetical protein
VSVRAIHIAAVLLCACGRLGFDSESPLPAPGGMGSAATTLDIGLVAHLALDGSLFDSVSGNDAECAAGECPGFVPGPAAEVATFDGAATCVHLPWLTTWTPSQYTVAAWIQPKAMTGPVVVREHDTSCPSPSLESSDAAVGFVGTDAAAAHEMAWTDAMLSSGTWTHVAIELDGTQQSVFVDGACACSVVPQIRLDYTTYEVTVGCYPAASTWFDGAIGDVRIYDRPLAGAELAELAGAPASADCAAACNTTQP